MTEKPASPGAPILSAVQKAHAEAFDERTPTLETLDFERYEGKPYGPWNPYWHVYDCVKAELRNPSRRLLVVGCGNGRDALIYAKMGFAVCGFDVSPKAIEIGADAAERFGMQERVKFSVQPAENLNYESESFDLAVGVNVLHHVDIERSLAELLRVLKPGGRAIFKEPLVTPRRDSIRNRPPVSWIIPKGVKSVPKGVYYDLVPGEKNLDAADLEMIKREVTNFSVKHWHVLAKLSALVGRRPTLEKIDWALFKILPFVRTLGDQAVLTFERPAVPNRISESN